MNPTTLRLLRFFLFSFFFVILFIVGALAFLSTEKGMTTLLSFAQKIVREKLDGEFFYKGAKLNLLRTHFRAENLHLNLRLKPSLVLGFEAQKLDLELRLGSLQKIHIKNLLIENPSLNLTFDSHSQDTSTKPNANLSPHEILKSLESSLLHPPLPISIDQVDISNLKLRIFQKDQLEKKNVLSLEGFHFHHFLDWSPEAFQIILSSDIQEGGSLLLFTEKGSLGLKGPSQLRISASMPPSLKDAEKRTRHIKVNELSAQVQFLPLNLPKVASGAPHFILDKKSFELSVPNLQMSPFQTKPAMAVLTGNFDFLNPDDLNKILFQSQLKWDNENIFSILLHLDLNGFGMKSPISWESEVHLSEKLASTFQPLVPARDFLPAHVRLQGEMEALQLWLKDSNRPLKAKGDFTLSHKSKALSFLSDPTSIQMGFELRPNRMDFVIEARHKSANGGLDLNFLSQGFFLPREFSTQSSGFLDIKIDQKNSLSPSNLQAKGILQVPYHLLIKQKTQMELEASIVFSDFSVQSENFGLESVQGAIPIRQRIAFCQNKKICYTELLQQNSFERVDYQQVHTLFHSQSKLEVNQVRFKNIQIGPIRTVPALAQNVFLLNQFDVELGNGVLSGEAFFDFLPQRLQLGFLGRVSDLDLGYFQTAIQNTQASSTLSKKTKQPIINGRSGVVLDLKKGLLNGRIDVTEISDVQLLQLFRILDPEYRNDHLNKARSVIAYAYPTYVGLDFHHGFLNMKINLEGAIKTQITLNELPTASLLISKTRPLIQTLKEIPLQ